VQIIYELFVFSAYTVYRSNTVNNKQLCCFFEKVSTEREDNTNNLAIVYFLIVKVNIPFYSIIQLRKSVHFFRSVRSLYFMTVYLTRNIKIWFVMCTVEGFERKNKLMHIYSMN